MTDFNFVTDAKLSKAAYDSNNNSNTAIIDGWQPMRVDPRGYQFQDTFGAQLYGKDGQYKIVYRGTEGNLPDWAVNKDYGLSVWTQEFQDTVVFAARAIVQMARDLRLDVNDAAQLFTTTGHESMGSDSIEKL